MSQAFHLTDSTGRFYDGHKTAHGGWSGWQCLPRGRCHRCVENRVETPPQRLSCEKASPLLEVEDLHVHFLTSRGVVRAVDGLSFHVDRGEVVAIVGESGSGKSVSALSIMRLLPRHTGRIPRGRVSFDGRDLLTLDDEEMRKIRGRHISMIFQEPMTLWASSSQSDHQPC